MSSQRSVRRLAVLVLPPLIWGSLIVFGAQTLLQWSARGLTLITWLIALLAILPFAWRGIIRERSIIRAEWPLLALLGVTGTVGFQWLWYEGLLTASPISVALLTPTLSMFVALAAWIFLRERLPPLAIGGLVLTVVGTMWIATEGHARHIVDLSLGQGELYVLAANVAMTVYTILMKRIPSRLSALSFFAVTVGFGVVAFTPFALTQPLAVVPMNSLSAIDWASLMYIGVVTYLGAYLCWNDSVAVNGAGITALFLLLQPLFAVLLVSLLLSQRPLNYHWSGGLLIVGGLAILALAERRAGMAAGVRT